jgi:hypothetical protein
VFGHRDGGLASKLEPQAQGKLIVPAGIVPSRASFVAQ